MNDLTITDVRTIVTQPQGVPLVIVKVLTSEPGLYGLGCATFSWRFRAVEACIEHHVKPFVVGKDPAYVEDIWQSLMLNGYWRNGPIGNNAISGVDMALWDIKGKRLGVPCYELWGGKSRAGAAVYVHADGRDKHEIAERALRYYEDGFRHIRCQMGGYRGITWERDSPLEGALPGQYCNPREKLHLTPELFAHLREALPPSAELLHDVHERLPPIDAVWLAKALEPMQLFFLEDLFAPEDIEWFQMTRNQCATPLAMGELFVHPGESTPLISRRLIDFIRVHPSDVGGVTPCLKLGHLCEAFGVRTAFHGPGDVSPVGMAANVHMDIHLHSFGIQEWVFRSELEEEIFPGVPRPVAGYVEASDAPGWGVDFDEDLARNYPCKDKVTEWTVARLADGTINRP